MEEALIVNRQNLLKNDQPSPILSGWLERTIVRRQINFQLFSLANTQLGSVRKGLLTLKRLKAKYSQFFNESMYHKMAKINGRYFWRVGAPGYPSEALRIVQGGEIARLNSSSRPHLRTLILAVTRKCPLDCQHCYEWNNLGKEEVLTLDDLNSIVRKFQEFGVGQIIFGGGEPMVRVRDVGRILENALPSSDFWIYTSGFRLDEEKARFLKSKGLTGVMVSLDHHRAGEHDQFRGYPGAFDMAINGLISSKNSNLVTGLALCATNEYCSELNIRQYLDLARQVGAAFVQFIEPKATGRYQGQSVHLTGENRVLLERLAREYNNARKYRDYPIVNYPDSVFRKVGCLAGDRFLYINSMGKVQQCPFCDESFGEASDIDVEKLLNRISHFGCQEFRKALI